MKTGERRIVLSVSDELFNELIAPIQDRMKRSVARIVRDPDDAADAFQDALTSIWKNLKAIHRHPNPQACILRICINSSYNVLRSRSRRRKNEVLAWDKEPGFTSFRTPARSVMTDEKIRQVVAAIGELPPKQGRAVLLRVINDEPYHAVAEALGCGEASARSHVSKGLARLRLSLKDIL